MELERLPGVGFRLAQQIVTFRQQQGPFIDLDQLLRVTGGEDINLDDLANFLYLEKVAPEQEAASETPAFAFSEAQSAPELQQARQAMIEGNLDQAVQRYAELIQSRQYLAEILQDMNEAVKYQPEQFELWQTLGDAHLRLDQVQEALDAYIKAEKLLG